MSYGWLVTNGSSSMKVLDLGEFLLAGDWESDNPEDGAKTFREAMTLSNGRRTVITMDEEDERLEGFYRGHGFRTLTLVKE